MRDDRPGFGRRLHTTGVRTGALCGLDFTSVHREKAFTHPPIEQVGGDGASAAAVSRPPPSMHRALAPRREPHDSRADGARARRRSVVASHNIHEAPCTSSLVHVLAHPCCRCTLQSRPSGQRAGLLEAPTALHTSFEPGQLVGHGGWGDTGRDERPLSKGVASRSPAEVERGCAIRSNMRDRTHV